MSALPRQYTWDYTLAATTLVPKINWGYSIDFQCAPDDATPQSQTTYTDGLAMNGGILRYPSSLIGRVGVMDLPGTRYKPWTAQGAEGKERPTNISCRNVRGTLAVRPEDQYLSPYT